MFRERIELKTSAQIDVMRRAGLVVESTLSLLRERAEAWLGRSVVGGSTPPAPAAPAGWTRDEVDAITVDARRYGFHGTLKPPFRLAEGRDLDGLDVVVIPGGDHGLKVPARGEVSQDEAMGIVVESTLEWLVREISGA